MARFAEVAAIHGKGRTMNWRDAVVACVLIVTLGVLAGLGAFRCSCDKNPDGGGCKSGCGVGKCKPKTTDGGDS